MSAPITAPPWSYYSGTPLTTAQVFTSNGTFVVPAGIFSVGVLLIAGGGGGGGANSTYGGAGGAAGQITTGLITVQPGDVISVYVGAGGAAGTSGSSPTAGANGGDSYIEINGSVPTSISGIGMAAQGGYGGEAATSSAGGTANDFQNPVLLDPLLPITTYSIKHFAPGSGASGSGGTAGMTYPWNLVQYSGMGGSGAAPSYPANHGHSGLVVIIW